MSTRVVHVNDHIEGAVYIGSDQTFVGDDPFRQRGCQ